MNKLCLRCLISGRVQGVFYRDSTRKEAERAGVTGWVRNLPDGRVEVMACGERDCVARLRAWLAKGPPFAKVTAVHDETCPWESHEGFTVRR